MRRSLRGLTRWALGLAVAGGALWALARAAGGLADAASALEHARWGWIAAAAAAAGASYLALGLQLRRLARPTADLPTRVGVSLALVVAGFGLLTPASPLEGLGIAGRELRRRGFTQRQATLTLGFGQWFAIRVFLLVTGVGIVVAAALGDLFERDVASVVAATASLALVLLVTARLARRPEAAARIAVLAGSLRFWRARPPAADRRATGAEWHREAMGIVGPPANRLVLVGLSVVAILADMAALWAALAAVGLHVRADVVVLAAVVGVLASSVPLLPGGLGLVEAAIPAVLHHFGAPLDAALAGALIYRAVGTFLPAGAGTAVVASLTLRRQPDNNP